MEGQLTTVDRMVQVLVDWFLTNGLDILIALVLIVVALRLSKAFSKKLLAYIQGKKDEEFQKRAETLGSIIRVSLNIAILIVGAMIILGEIGVQIGPVLATAGVFGLAIGFGAQNLVQDIISGFFLLLEDQVRVGDVVQVAGKGGLVEKVTLRLVILRDLSGNVHYVRNGMIDVVTNMTKEYSRYVFDINVAYREDLDQVIEVIKGVDADLRNDPDFKELILEPIEILGLNEFSDSAVVIRARTKTKPVQQWTVGREFNRRLKRRFDQEGIEIPYPHQVLYFATDNKGRTRPLQVQVANEPEGLSGR
jgi:small conductance mechanosensitive channel